MLYDHLSPGNPALSTVDATQIFEHFQRMNDSSILVVDGNECLIASCVLVIVPNLSRGGWPYAHIENVVTHRDYRKRGHGTAMLLAACERAWAHGCYKVMLMTGSRRNSTFRF